MQDKIDRIIELASMAEQLCTPLKVYKNSGGRQRFLEELDIDPDRLEEGEWATIKMSMPPHDYNIPLYSGPSGHYLTWQQCLDLTDAFNEFNEGRAYKLNQAEILHRAEKVIDRLRCVDLYREAALHQAEVTGMPILQPEAQYFPALKNRPELVLGEPDLYHIVCAHVEGTKLASEIRAEMAQATLGKLPSPGLR